MRCWCCGSCYITWEFIRMCLQEHQLQKHAKNLFRTNACRLASPVCGFVCTCSGVQRDTNAEHRDICVLCSSYVVLVFVSDLFHINKQASAFLYMHIHSSMWTINVDTLQADWPPHVVVVLLGFSCLQPCIFNVQYTRDAPPIAGKCPRYVKTLQWTSRACAVRSTRINRLMHKQQSSSETHKFDA